MTRPCRFEGFWLQERDEKVRKWEERGRKSVKNAPSGIEASCKGLEEAQYDALRVGWGY